IMLRKIFFINDKKITKFSTVLLIIIYSLIQCLQIYYMCKNFSLNLLIKYSPVTIFFLFMIVTAIFCMTMDKKICEMVTFVQKTCWSLNMIRRDAQIKFEKKCQVINICIFFILLLNIIGMIVNYPHFGSQKDFFICFTVFEEYFGEWSFIPYYCYIVGTPLLYYYYLKICFICVYGILQVQLQFLLIEEYLLQIYEIDHLKSWKYLQDAQYQQEIGNMLRHCITHHIALKKF
ncbi:uncharacterized protein LOC123011421, partial [Tribolium madens]|uniref:uncharacterized protein LOC123011421 n=1 Tax=Tribolium madens TaxID=41895 RepID=UPI001CF75C75